MWSHPERHPGDVLRLRFLDPLHLSPEDLSRDAGLPPTAVAGLLAGEQPITADIALRLARWLRMEPEFWLGLQGAWDLAHCGEPRVRPAPTDGYVVGPDGALRLPPARRPTTVEVPVSAELRDRIRAGAALAGEDEPRTMERVQYPDGPQAFVSTRR